MEERQVQERKAKDPRNYFAAERTFLAWIRTGLSLMGFGFVVARFGLFLRETAAAGHETAVKSYGFSIWAGTAMVLVGVFMVLTSAFRHVQIIARLNRGENVVGRPSYTAVVVALMLAMVGLAMVAFLITVR
jgi:putative membrane protein